MAVIFVCYFGGVRGLATTSKHYFLRFVFQPLFRSETASFCNADLPRARRRDLAFRALFGIVPFNRHPMNVRNINVPAMIIGMIIISRRPGRGRIA